MPCAITLALANTLQNVQGNPTSPRTPPFISGTSDKPLNRPAHTDTGQIHLTDTDTDTFSSQSHRATHDYKVYFSMSSVAHPLWCLFDSFYSGFYLPTTWPSSPLLPRPPPPAPPPPPPPAPFISLQVSWLKTTIFPLLLFCFYFFCQREYFEDL